MLSDNAFHYLGYAQEVIFGPGALARLGEAAERFGWRRLLLCTTGSASRLGHVAQIERLLGERLRATYDHAQPHVPETQVMEALALAAAHEVEAVIGLGGGSPIGMAKAVSQRLEEQRTGRAARAAFPTEQPLVPVIAIPTTYAGSEMTPTYGVTRQTPDGETLKVTVTDPKAAAKLVIYDPELTLDLPPELTASTGINAFAHCVEALYSITRHPLSSAAAQGGMRAIAQALPRCHAAPRDLPARTEMLAGAHLAGASLPAPPWRCTMACATCWAARPVCHTALPTASSCRTPCASTRRRWCPRPQPPPGASWWPPRWGCRRPPAHRRRPRRPLAPSTP